MKCFSYHLCADLSISIFVKLAECLSENGLLLFCEDFENFLQKLRILHIHKYKRVFEEKFFL